MAQDCVVAVYDSFDQARAAIESLEADGFPAEQISFVTHEVRGELKQPASVKSGDEAERSAVAGAAAGGLVGALPAAPLLAIPGVGPVLLAGPISAGLTGAIVGGFLGSMAGWGVHRDQIAHYQQLINAGKLLIVASGDPQQVAAAAKTLQSTEPDQLTVHAQTSADAPDVIAS